MPSATQREQQRIAELNKKNRELESKRVSKALAEERMRAKKQRDMEIRKRMEAEEARKKAEAEKAAQAQLDGTDDLFDDASRTVTPQPNGVKPDEEKKEQPKGLPTFRKSKMDDDIIASIDIGVDLEI
jgi:multidrug efflux pump subunit AcrA (membrane-fusion protein)